MNFSLLFHAIETISLFAKIFSVSQHEIKLGQGSLDNKFYLCDSHSLSVIELMRRTLGSFQFFIFKQDRNSW